ERRRPKYPRRSLEFSRRKTKLNSLFDSTSINHKFIMQSEDKHQEQDQNHHPYQQPDPTKVIWKALQRMKLGADRSRWSVHDDAQKEFEKDHRLCLVAKGLNMEHQNSPGIKVALPKTWQLVGKVEGQINDDGTVNFYFDTEHHLLMVLEKQPYTYRGWLVVLDRWINRDSPTFLKQIPFKIRVEKLPDVYRRHSIVESICSRLGHVEEVTIVEPSIFREAEVTVKVYFDVDDQITLTREVEIIKGKTPVELDFRYEGLQKFCLLCGSLRHEYELCSECSKMQPRQFELMDIGTNPYASVQERDAAIREYITIKETGESSGTATLMQTEPPPALAAPRQMTQSRGQGVVINPAEAAPTQAHLQYRQRQWSQLISSEQEGDFNDIKRSGEKQEGIPRTVRSCSCFTRMLTVLGLHDVKTLGGRFTWFGKRSNYSIMSKIDRAVANCNWLDIYPSATVSLLTCIGSDHRSLLLNTDGTKRKKSSLFRYDSRWRLYPGLKHVVEQACNQQNSNVSNGNIHSIICHCRRALSKWRSKQNTNSGKLIQEIKQEIQRIRVWRDNWLLGDPQPTPTGPGRFFYPNLKVKDLFFPGAFSWNQPLLNQLFQPEDALRILRLRPSITGTQDLLYWKLSKTGSYTVRSGYYVQRAEIWQLAYPDLSRSLEPHTNLLMFVHKIVNEDTRDLPSNLAWFIGWRIWKMRNRLLFDNNREHIVQVIKGSFMDLNLWKEAIYYNEPDFPTQVKDHRPHSIIDVLPQESMLYCIADASWKSEHEAAGIGWSLYSRQGTFIMQGSSAIASTNSAFEAVAVATLLAVQQLHRLHYKNVIFLGDNARLFKSLEPTRGRENTACHEASTMVQDILNLAKLNDYSFKQVPRNLVYHVDQLAKRARLSNQQYVITWLSP
ncbi:hypothetical protein HID58_041948, partial [Brassica napus]